MIDVGSNSGRVVVFRAGPHRHLEILADARSPLRLALDVSTRARLSADAMERSVAALRDFRALARGSGALRIIAVGTAAIREAENGAELVDRIRIEAGIRVKVISGEEEARLGFLGAVHGLQADHGLLVDVGGGSVEVSRFRDRRLTASWSLPLGSLRLSARFLRSDPPTEEEVDDLCRHVRATFQDTGIPELGPDEQLTGTGGTVRNLAKVDRRTHTYPIPRVHGYVLTRRRVQDVARMLAARRLSRRKSTAGLSSERADSIVGGALVTLTAMESVSADQLVVSGQGLREGIAYDTMGLAPPSGEEVRSAAIRALVERFVTFDEGRAARRARIACSLLEAAYAEAGPRVRERLEQAATVLDIGRAIDYYRRFEHTSEVLVASDLIGFSHRKLALLAAVVRQAGDESANVRHYGPLLTGADRVPVAKSAALLAIADEIEQRVRSLARPRGTTPVRCEVRGRQMVLTAPLFDPYSRHEHAERFRRAFGRRLVIDPVGEV